MAGDGAAERPLRADAVRNRALIMAAATELFAARGLDVTLDDIARHAGVGVGTVYRRFADREALVDALFQDRVEAAVGLLTASLAEPDPWQALVRWLRDTCAQLAVDRGMRQIMLSSVYGHDQVARAREQFQPLAEQLVRRAKDAGRVRPDLAATDIPMLFLMIGTVADFAGDAAPAVWQRYLEMLIDGIRVGDGTPAVLPPAATEDELAAAMLEWRPPGRRGAAG